MLVGFVAKMAVSAVSAAALALKSAGVTGYAEASQIQCVSQYLW